MASDDYVGELAVFHLVGYDEPLEIKCGGLGTDEEGFIVVEEEVNGRIRTIFFNPKEVKYIEMYGKLKSSRKGNKVVTLH